MSDFENKWGPFARLKTKIELNTVESIEDGRIKTYPPPPLEDLDSNEDIEEECDPWLTNLLHDYSPKNRGANLQEQQNIWLESNQDQVLIYWQEKLFIKVLAYVKRINKKLFDPSKRIAYRAPELKRSAGKQTGNLPPEERKYIEGHFATRNEALVLKARGAILQARIVPSVLLLGVSLDTVDDGGFPSLLTIEVLSRKTAILIQLEKKVDLRAKLDETAVGLLAKLLLERLLQAERNHCPS